MNTHITHPLPKSIFEDLANKHDLHCVSIYLSMYKSGKEQNEQLAQANLKRCIKEVHTTLEKYELKNAEINRYLKPIKELLSDIELWRNPSDGIAIFLDKKGLNYYLLPIPFERETYVADHFYLLPLLPLYNEDGIYYLLELSQDYVKLYMATKYGYKDVYIEDFAPDELEKVVGYDFKQKMVQLRSGQYLQSAGSFHGLGEGKDDKKKEINTFLRAIDRGIKKNITNQKSPLVLACTNSLYAMYKDVNSYPTLYEKNISGDPEFTDKNKLFQDSWKIVQPFFEKTKKDKIAQFMELYNTPKTSYEINEIIPAAIYGKIDTLFLASDNQLFGLYNGLNNHVRIDEEKEITNASLTNMVAVKTFSQGGNVFLLKPHEMPIKKTTINALYRY